MPSSLKSTPCLRQQRMRDAARTLWLEHGYRTSMDAVAKRAGCSKQTVYAHFGNKESLFRCVIDDLVAPLLANLEFSDCDLENALLKFAEAHIERRSLPENIARWRLVASEATRHPDDSRALIRRGIEAILERLASTIGKAMRRGELREDDPVIAAEMFMGMIYGVESDRQLLGSPARACPEMQRIWAQKAVSNFMKIYSVSQA